VKKDSHRIYLNFKRVSQTTLDISDSHSPRLEQPETIDWFISVADAPNMPASFKHPLSDPSDENAIASPQFLYRFMVIGFVKIIESCHDCSSTVLALSL
jgi:hypothetical protein